MLQFLVHQVINLLKFDEFVSFVRKVFVLGSFSQMFLDLTKNSMS